jgi:tetratricopeptide (TPR) repeat protein
MQRYEDSAVYLKAAADGFRTRGRPYFNLGLALQRLGRLSEAERALLRAVEIEPGNRDFLYAIADHYLKRGQPAGVRKVAELARETLPGDRLARDLDELLERAAGDGGGAR